MWLQKIFEGNSKTRMEYCKNKDGILCNLRAIQGHSGGIPIEPQSMGYVFIPRNWKRYINHRGRSWNSQSILGKGLIPGGKEKDKARRAVFLTPTNPFGDDPEEERPHDDFTVPQKAPHVTKWKYDQNAVCWVRLSKAQDQGLEFWQTKSFAIMTYATIPGDCMDRVASQNGERVLFERLETPRLVPKVKLEKNWQSQQQHSSSCTDVPGLVKTMVVKEHWTGAQDGSKFSTEVKTSSGKLGQIASDMETDTVLKKEDITDMVSQVEAVKEEAHTEVMERSNIGSNKICILSDLAKKNMMFSQESCQAIIEMGNVE